MSSLPWAKETLRKHALSCVSLRNAGDRYPFGRVYLALQEETTDAFNCLTPNTAFHRHLATSATFTRACDMLKGVDMLSTTRVRRKKERS